MRFIFVNSKDAEALRKYLVQKDIIAGSVKAVKREDEIGFPIQSEKEEGAKDFLKKNKISCSEKDIDIKIKKPSRSIEGLLSEKLKDKTKFLKKSFDVIGSIAIMEGSEELKDFERDIAEAIMKVNRHIRSVYIKNDIHQGEFRIQPIRHVLGEKNTETVHRENGYRIYLDVAKTYFSPRLAGERERIAKMIKKGEDALVLFSGVGPYGIAIAKISEAKSIICVELNQNAHEHAVINAEKNKVRNMECINDDARKACEKMAEEGKKFDRIIMPLPRLAHTFLKAALGVSKEGTTIHLYQFCPEDEIRSKITKTAENEIGGLCDYEINHIERVGQYAPGKFRVCAEIEIKRIRSL